MEEARIEKSWDRHQEVCNIGHQQTNANETKLLVNDLQLKLIPMFTEQNAEPYIKTVQNRKHIV